MAGDGGGTKPGLGAIELVLLTMLGIFGNEVAEKIDVPIGYVVALMILLIVVLFGIRVRLASGSRASRDAGRRTHPLQWVLARPLPSLALLATAGVALGAVAGKVPGSEPLVKLGPLSVFGYDLVFVLSAICVLGLVARVKPPAIIWCCCVVGLAAGGATGIRLLSTDITFDFWLSMGSYVVYLAIAAAIMSGETGRGIWHDLRRLVQPVGQEPVAPVDEQSAQEGPTN